MIILWHIRSTLLTLIFISVAVNNSDSDLTGLFPLRHHCLIVSFVQTALNFINGSRGSKVISKFRHTCSGAKAIEVRSISKVRP